MERGMVVMDARQAGGVAAAVLNGDKKQGTPHAKTRAMGRRGGTGLLGCGINAPAAVVPVVRVPAAPSHRRQEPMRERQGGGRETPGRRRVSKGEG